MAPRVDAGLRRYARHTTQATNLTQDSRLRRLSFANPLTIEQRHHAAAYAAAANALGIDAILTNAPTAGRCDVADNDVVASITPDDAVALIGH